MYNVNLLHFGISKTKNITAKPSKFGRGQKQHLIESRPVQKGHDKQGRTVQSLISSQSDPPSKYFGIPVQVQPPRA